MPGKPPAFQFYTGDHLKDPQLSMCSPATRGIWVDLLCVLHELGRSGQVTGTPEQLCRACRCTAAEFVAAIAELSATGAADIHRRNGEVTIVNRRMQREHRERVMTNERVRRHRGNDPVTPPETPVKRNRNGPSSSSTSRSKSTDVDLQTDDSPSSSAKKGKVSDIRTQHPAIKACRQTVSSYPPKELWDSIIELLGENPDLERMKACRAEWVDRGYNRASWKWLTQWYSSEIPERLIADGTNRQTGQPRSATTHNAREARNTIKLLLEDDAFEEAENDHNSDSDDPAPEGAPPDRGDE